MEASVIIERIGNILKANVQALVNPVNCVGVARRGLDLLFRRAWPSNFYTYTNICKAGLLRPGKLHIFPTGRLGNPKWIINFPTKDDWRDKSKLIYIEAGLDSLVECLTNHRIESVAIPPLGCGLGGLKWEDVEKLIRDRFAARRDIIVDLYRPSDEPVGDLSEE
jgi:O-acetyl-ADP-ribose deacetylase (regulator of RNase III)